MTTTPHIGRNICKLRELREIKQETMAEQLGISQQAVSKIEQNETIEDVTLGRIAKVLGFSPEVIRNYSDQAVINNIQNIYDNGSGPYNQFANDKLMEENRRLVDEMKALVEQNRELSAALLKEKDERIVLLQQVLDMKKSS